MDLHASNKAADIKHIHCFWGANDLDSNVSSATKWESSLIWAQSSLRPWICDSDDNLIKGAANKNTYRPKPLSWTKMIDSFWLTHAIADQ